MSQIWEVVGGADKGGIIVREGKDLKSTQTADRLSTGALVKELAFEGERLQYERLTGSGPAVGWVSIKLKDKELVVRTDKTPPAGEEEPAEPAAGGGGDGIDTALRRRIEGEARTKASAKEIETLCMKYKVLGCPLAAGSCKFRVFAFHSAGSAESMYTGPAMNPFLTWVKETKAIEFIVPSYPGRDKMRDKPLLEKADEVAAYILPIIFNQIADGTPFAFWGHSVGNWVAFEILMLMRKIGLPMPACCCFNAFPPPSFPEADRPWRVNRTLSDKQMKDELMLWDEGHFGKDGRGKIVYDEPDWTGTYLPMMRADFRLYDEYKFNHTEAEKFDFPIFARHFEGEHFIRPEWVEQWRDWTTGPFEMDVMTGCGHLTSVYNPPSKKAYFAKVTDNIKQVAGL